MPIEPQRFAEMTDYELLAVALHSEELAENLTTMATIDQLFDHTRQELGLTNARYQRLMAGIELGRRISDAKQQYEIPERLESSDKAIAFCQKHFSRLIADSMQEELHVITLSPKMHVMRTYCVSVGTLDAMLIHPREVLRPAVRDAASAFLLAHHRPTVDSQPTEFIQEVTRRIESAVELIGIQLLDYIIMTRNGCTSMRETSREQS